MSAKRFWLLLTLFSLIGQVAWVVENMYLNVFIYNMFSASPGEISAMVIASSVVATLTTLLIGALSDSVGRRKIFICLGYILWGVSILGFALVRVDLVGALLPVGASVSAVCITLTIALDCLMTFFGSSANDAAFNAWLTDSSEKYGRGRAEGINAMMPLVAILVVFGGFMAFDLKQSSSWTVIFIIIGAVVTAIGVASLFLMKEQPPKEKGDSYFTNILYGFRPSVVKHNYMLYLAVIAFAIFGISIQIFMPYLIIYYQETLKLDNYVLIMAPAIILAAVLTALYGRVYDKHGFLPAILPSLGMLCLGYILLGLFKEVPLVFIGSLLMMSGYLTGMAVFGALIRDKTPAGKAGAFQGLRIVGQVLVPGIIGPMIGAAVLQGAEILVKDDGTESFLPNASIFWAALVVAAVAILSSVLIGMLMKKKSVSSERL